MRDYEILGLVFLLSVGLSACVNLKKSMQVWDPAPYFALEHQTEIEGMKIVYLECGQDNPEAIVFIHGWSGNVMNWWDQFEYFRDDYHILLPDLPGHGKSDKPEDFDYSVASFAKVIVELMEEVGIEKATVVGNSLGGAIAGYIAIHYPERVEKLVLSDSAGVPIDPDLQALAPLLTPMMIRWTGVTSARQYPPTNEKNRVRGEFSASYRGTKEEIAYLTALDKALTQIAKFDFTNDLSKIQAPTLILWGDNDKTVPFKIHQTFAEKIPNNKVYVVKKGGHTPNMSKPAEFNCALEKFLKDENLEPCHQISEIEAPEK